MIPGSIIPIGDDDSGIRRRHFLVWLLILANVLVFVHQLRLSSPELERFVYQYGTIPWEITNWTDMPPTIGFPVVGTVFTSMFIHGGLLHIGFNMLFLWIFGDNIEDVMSRLGFLAFYVLCGIAAAVTQIVVYPSSQVPVVGASGAISGIMGAYLVLFPGGIVRVAAIVIVIPFIVRLPAIIVIGFWIIVQFFSGYATLGMEDVAGGTAYFAHIGGFLAGLALVWLFVDQRAVRRQKMLSRRL